MSSNPQQDRDIEAVKRAADAQSAPRPTTGATSPATDLPADPLPGEVCTCPDLATLDPACPTHGDADVFQVAQQRYSDEESAFVNAPKSDDDPPAEDRPATADEIYAAFGGPRPIPRSDSEGFAQTDAHGDGFFSVGALTVDDYRQKIGLPKIGTQSFDQVMDEQWPTTSQRARTILQRAADLVDGDRNTAYGDARDNFAETAALWQVVLSPMLRPGVQITPEQVALCMNQLKVARLIRNPGHADSWVDGAGYLGLGGAIANGPGPVADH